MEMSGFREGLLMEIEYSDHLKKNCKDPVNRETSIREMIEFVCENQVRGMTGPSGLSSQASSLDGTGGAMNPCAMPP